MEQKTTLAQSMDAAEQKAQYDAACKRVLAEKIILAWIMKHTMKEYAECTVDEIAKKYIEGTPEIATVPLLRDQTSLITGMSVEDTSITEGTVTYDIRFHAIIPATQEQIGLIINVEAQNDFYPGYPIIKRGIYYCCRMISSQYETEFTNAHYEKIKKVYSVWICMNPPKNRENSITEYALAERNIVGAVTETVADYDLMNVVIICLGTAESDNDNALLKLLNVLLSNEKSTKEKKQILEDEFDIAMTTKMESEVIGMCNLSEGVERKGIEKGLQQGLQQARQSVILNMLKDNMSIEKICQYTGCDEAYVKELQQQ